MKGSLPTKFELRVRSLMKWAILTSDCPLPYELVVNLKKPF